MSGWCMYCVKYVGRNAKPSQVKDTQHNIMCFLMVAETVFVLQVHDVHNSNYCSMMNARYNQQYPIHELAVLVFSQITYH
jgi:hypothetical protein